jgi:hypothetical protein
MRGLAMPCAPVSRIVDSSLLWWLIYVYLGPEHSGTAAGTGQPSYCTLPLFHVARNPNGLVNGLGYISNDGHLFDCNNPVVMQQAFHM